MGDFLTFRKMMMPIIIQVLFWIGVVVVIIAGIAVMTEDFLRGMLTIVIGPLVVRLYAELLIVIFRIHDRLNEVNETLAEIRQNSKQPLPK